MYQRTIKQRVHCTGVGLHSGKAVGLTMRPAAEDTGVAFHITTPSGKKTISPSPDAVIATGLATTLGKDGVAVSTVEHILAALRGLAIDNIHIDIDGGEIPIMDGSAASFVLLLNEAGVHVQSKPRKMLRVKKSLKLEHDEKSIQAEPYAGFLVDYTIAFPHKAIGTQRRVLNLTPGTFPQVAKARTFGFLRDVEALKERGLALGGSLNNAVVLDESGVVNQEGLRYADEFVRHKILDFIGDMAMLGLPLEGKFTVRCSGHALNNEFLRKLAHEGSGYLEEVSLTREAKTRHQPPVTYPALDGGAAAFAR